MSTRENWPLSKSSNWSQVSYLHQVSVRLLNVQLIKRKADAHLWRLCAPKRWRSLGVDFLERRLLNLLSLFRWLPWVTHGVPEQILVRASERRGNTNGLLAVQVVRLPCRWGLCGGPAGDHHDEGLQTLQHRGLLWQLSAVSWRPGACFFIRGQHVKSFLPRVHRCVRVFEEDSVVHLCVVAL